MNFAHLKSVKIDTPAKPAQPFWKTRTQCPWKAKFYPSLLLKDVIVQFPEYFPLNVAR